MTKPIGCDPDVNESAALAWPKARDVGRYGDMSLESFIRVGLDADNDVYVTVHGSDLEFCTAGNGGGKSPRTREALIALMVAIEADNRETPSKDWWAKPMTPNEK